MMMRLSFLVVLFIASFAINKVSAQDSADILNTFPRLAKLEISNNNQLFFMTRNSIEKKVIGNPYLFDWAEAFLVSNEGEVFSVRARYRSIDDEFQVMLNGKVKALYPQSIKGIIFKDRAFVPAKFEVNSRTALSFFELMSEGRTWLLKRHGMSTKNTKDGFMKINEQTSKLYYLLKDEHSAMQYAEVLPTKQKNVLQALGEYKDEIESYASSNSINYTNARDIKKLFDYYNSLRE